MSNVFTPKFIGKAAIVKATESVVSRGKAYNRHVQSVVLSCLAHTAQHGDWTLTSELIAANQTMPAKLIGFSERAMNATYDKKTGKFTYNEGASAKDIDMDKTSLENWFEFKAPAIDRTKDLVAIREALAKTLKTSVNANKVEANEESEILATLDALIEVRNVAEAEAA